MKQTCLINAKKDEKGIAGQARNNSSFLMKKSVFTVAVMALVLATTACKSNQKISETGSENKGLLEKYWKLDQIMGADITGLDSKSAKDAFITLKKEENRLVGNAGCNSITGTYELGEGNRIRFSQMVTTQKMCMDMTVEDKMKKALETADSYYLKNDTLTLNRARMAPLARFVAVYMK
jgi:heat shock protein HslJ